MKKIGNFFRYIIFIPICILFIELIYLGFINIIEYIFYSLNLFMFIIVLFFLFGFIMGMYQLLIFFLIMGVSYIVPDKKVGAIILSILSFIYGIFYIYDIWILDTHILLKIIISGLLISFMFGIIVISFIQEEN